MAIKILFTSLWIHWAICINCADKNGKKICFVARILFCIHVLYWDVRSCREPCMLKAKTDKFDTPFESKFPENHTLVEWTCPLTQNGLVLLELPCRIYVVVMVSRKCKPFNRVTRIQRTQRLVFFFFIFARVISRDYVKPKRSERDEGL